MATWPLSLLNYPSGSITGSVVVYNDVANTLQQTTAPSSGNDLTNKTYVDSIATFKTLGFVTVGTGLGFDYSTIQLAQADAKTKIVVCTNTTETIGFAFGNELNIIFVPGITLTISDISWTGNSGGAANINFSVLGFGTVEIIWNSTTNKNFIDLTACILSSPTSFLGTFVVLNTSNISIAAPFYNAGVGTNQFFIQSNGVFSYFPNGNSGSSLIIDNINAADFSIIGSNVGSDTAITVNNGGEISNIYFFGDFTNTSNLLNLTNVSIGSIKSTVSTSGSSFSLTDCRLNSVDSVGGAIHNMILNSINYDCSISNVSGCTLTITGANGNLNKITINNGIYSGLSTSGIDQGYLNLNNVQFTSAISVGVSNLTVTDNGSQYKAGAFYNSSFSTFTGIKCGDRYNNLGTRTLTFGSLSSKNVVTGINCETYPVDLGTGNQLIGINLY